MEYKIEKLERMIFFPRKSLLENFTDNTAT